MPQSACLQHYVDNCPAPAVARAARRAAARSLSRVAERGDAAADHGRSRDAALRALHRALADGRGARRRAGRGGPAANGPGLGYYARARNLIACARAGRRARRLSRRPRPSFAQLPGLGAYTAAAIAAIAFGERGRGGRHQCRAGRRPAPWHRATDRKSRRSAPLAEAMTPPARPGDFAQAMMDLGATICRPASADCGACPLAADCARLRAAARPKPSRAQGQARAGRTAMASPGGSSATARVWLVRRPAKGLLGGMAALPGPDWSDAPQPDVPALATVRHGFTHFTLDLHGRARRAATATAGGSRSTASTRPACRRFTAAPASWCWRFRAPGGAPPSGSERRLKKPKLHPKGQRHSKTFVGLGRAGSQ